MQLLDLTENYLAMKGGGRRDAYEAVAPWFFDHYFSFWSDAKKEYPDVSGQELVIRKNHILHFLKRVEDAARAQRIETGNMTAVLFVGKGVSNGHAFLNADGNPVVWFAVESYLSQAAARTFVAHEFAHALHYAADPSFAFTTLEDKNGLGRQLMTEGFATLVAQDIESLSDEEALWADYLDRKKFLEWQKSCELRLKELSAACVAGWKEDAGELFFANDSTDVSHFRAGYYIGLKVMQEFAREKKVSWASLLTQKRANLEGDVLKSLQAMR